MNDQAQMNNPAAENVAEYDENSDMCLGTILGITTAVCTGIALLLWVAVPSIGAQSITPVLVHSLSIGLTAALLTVYSTRQLDNQRRTSAIWLIVLLIPVSIIAFFVGSILARLFLGLPLNPFGVFASTSDTVSLITTIIATAMCTGFFLSRNHINRLKLQATQDAHRVQSAKLSMLQAQIEPHMLFNTLANLRALIHVDPARAITMLDRLDGFLRMTLEGSRNSSNSLLNEFAGIENYLAIMQIRLGDRLTYSLDLPKELVDIKVPSLLIQPVVENAILHGIEPCVNGGHLSVCARMESDALCVDVRDTGVGINKSENTIQPPRPNCGFGLHSLQVRLPDFNGQPGVQIHSPLPDSVRGTQVCLRVQI